MAHGVAVSCNWGDPRLPDALWQHTQPCPMSGCWFWIGPGEQYKPTFDGGNAKRLVWRQLVGSLPDKVRLLSRCGGDCINPAHMVPNSIVVDGAEFQPCKKCKKFKPRSEFWTDTSRGKRRDGQCRACGLAALRAWREANPDWAGESNRRHANRRRVERIAVIGAPVRCEICGSPFSKTPHYDHNHKTGAGRGWLCSSCNTGIGQLGDNPRILDRAAEYLRARGHAATRPVIK